MSRAAINRGVIWGQLLKSLDVARDALRSAECHGIVLEPGERRRIREAFDFVIGIDQRAWSALQRTRRAPAKARRKGGR